MEGNEPVKIFIVEDDPSYMKFLQYVVGLNPDHEIRVFTSGNDLIHQLYENPSIITLDYSLPDMSGKEVLRKIKETNPDTHVIIVSGQEQIGTAVELLKSGAYDYITKDTETKERLIHSIDHAKNNVLLIKEVNHLRREINSKYDFTKGIIGNSEPMKNVFHLIQKAIQTNINITISGDTGTGKELVAKAIHYNSNRKNKPFIPVNIAAIPRELIESELFGHEKGSFTGAISRRIGKFEEAQHGTLFLDEIGEMEINLQAKLLRVIQEREFSRIGGNALIPIDVRIVVATHKDLVKEVKAGRFREDLFYRLLGLQIKLPLLRERGNDILLLAKHFVDEFCRENNLAKKTISPGSREKLLKYSFPGNVRELRSVMELATVMSKDEIITEEDIQFNSLEKTEAIYDQEMTLRNYIYQIVKHYLKKYRNNVLLVSEKLDIGKSTIYRYLKEIDEFKPTEKNEGEIH